MNRKLPKTALTREVLRLSTIGKHFVVQDEIINILHWAKDQGINTDDLLRDVLRVWVSRKS